MKEHPLPRSMTEIRLECPASRLPRKSTTGWTLEPRRRLKIIIKVDGQSMRCHVPNVFSRVFHSDGKYRTRSIVTTTECSHSLGAFDLVLYELVLVLSKVQLLELTDLTCLFVCKVPEV